MNHPALFLQHINQRFGGLQALNAVSLELHPGEIHALIGPNGAGKSTLMQVISGTLKPDSGQIYLNQHDITPLAPYRRARLGLGRAFQTPALFQGLSVLQNVLLATHQHLAQATTLLRQVNLESRAPHTVNALSHGEQRRLEVALALANQPSVLLLDEPLAGLGSEEAQHMRAWLHMLKRQYTVLLVEHDMDAVFALADRVSVLVEGCLIATDTPEKIRAHAQVQAAYLGDAAGAPA